MANNVKTQRSATMGITSVWNLMVVRKMVQINKQQADFFSFFFFDILWTFSLFAYRREVSLIMQAPALQSEEQILIAHEMKNIVLL